MSNSRRPYFQYLMEPQVWTPEIRDVFLKSPIRICEDGCVQIPQELGLGVELNEETICKYTVKAA